MTIEDRPLKEFFRLFDKDEKLEIVELGDTWHTTSGFIDQTFFVHIHTVQDLLNIDYDFKGLISLIAKIRGLVIEYDGKDYKINGGEKEIEKIKFSSLYRLDN